MKQLKGRFWMAGMVMVLATGMSLSACSSPRLVLGTNSNLCFKALPVAEDAVHHQGRLLGVKKLDYSTLVQRLERGGTAVAPQSSAVSGETEVCVIGFRGHYGPGSVQYARPGSNGTYAVLAVTVENQRVIGAFIVQRLPVGLGHL
ncbi:MAG: hypothetical protein ACYCS7_05260 [Acidimicrobiales bacterium]